MIRILSFFVVFLVSFFIFFIYTFPSREVFGKYLSKYGIKYDSISGNLLKTKIKGLTYDNFVKIDDIAFSNKFYKMEFLINKKQKLSVFPLEKEAKLKFKNLEINKYTNKISGTLNLKGKIFIKDNYILSNLNGDSFLRTLPVPIVKDIKVSLKTMAKEKENKIKAKIFSSNITGEFNGVALIPINIQNATLKGNFEGKLYGSKIKQNISLRFKDIINGNLKLF